jgi:acetoin utilization deacetylase AcuC-like enzyme
MATALLTHPHFQLHSSSSAHPERPQRTTALEERLRVSGLWQELAHLDFDRASEQEIAACHSPDMVESVRLACEQGWDIDGDTYVNERSFEVASLGAGAALRAADAVCRSEVANAFVCSRPPGHHAESQRAMGFCLFNNAALAARRARQYFDRVAVLDWDVHHGNGTQEIFYRDPSVFFASLHEWPLFPGTGAHSEIGEGEGRGTTLNVPLPRGCGDTQYLGQWRALRAPLEEFAPQAIVLSAGFDAHRLDPLGHMEVTEQGFAAMARELMGWAGEWCGGRVVAVLEGGYSLEGLSMSAEAVVREMASC